METVVMVKWYSGTATIKCKLLNTLYALSFNSCKSKGKLIVSMVEHSVTAGNMDL
jgi:hypothetical protein